MVEHGSTDQAPISGVSAQAPMWGVSAEFDTAEAMLAALHGLKPQDLGRLDAFSPAPVPGASAALGLAMRPIVPFTVLGALLGAAVMFAMCSYATIWGYRFNIGGRPLFSWPAFIVPSVSFGALLGTIVTFLLLLTFNRLPRLNHPAFNIPGFGRATADRFFVAVEARDARFDPAAVEAVLAGLVQQPRRVCRVPR